ncbi:MAG: sensor histidine kinase, partial [Bacteroidota bacterium]
LVAVEQLSDSLNTQLLNTANYKTNYAVKKAEKDFVQSMLQVASAERLSQRIMIGALSVGMFLLSGIFVLIVVLRQQKQKRIDAENEVDDLLTNLELETTYARIEGQDTLRHRIAQDLHDGLGSTLSTVKLYFSNIEQKLDQVIDAKDQYSKAYSLLDKACEEVRKVSHEMQSANLTRFGLSTELESMVQGIQESHQIQAELITHQMENRLEAKVEHQLYKIVQEIIANILKHARASKLSIEISRFDDLVSLVIEDNGIGFNPKTVQQGIGLQGIKARVNQLNGTFNIDSEIGRGTSISIDIPHTKQ